MNFNKFLLFNKNFYIFYWVLSFIVLINMFLLKIIIFNKNIFIFIKDILGELVLVDIFKLNIKFLKEINRLQLKDKTKWTFFKWFIMWFSLIYPKYLILKFIFCFIRYFNKYLIFIIKYLLENCDYVKKINFFYSIYLLFLLYEQIFQFFFFIIPYKLSFFYIQFRILFFLDELNRFVGSDNFDLILYPFSYWYKEYFVPYQNYLDNILPERYYIIKYDIRERKKILSKILDNIFDIFFTFQCKFIFTKESISYKFYIKIYKNKVNFLNILWNIFILLIYFIIEIFYEIGYLYFYFVLFLLYFFKFNCVFFVKLIKYFFFGLFYVYIFIKWLFVRFW